MTVPIALRFGLALRSSISGDEQDHFEQRVDAGLLLRRHFDEHVWPPQSSGISRDPSAGA
jgi:hypothetical protein